MMHLIRRFGHANVASAIGALALIADIAVAVLIAAHVIPSA